MSMMDGTAENERRMSPMASLLADRASAEALFTAGLMMMVGFVPLVAGLVAAFVDGHLTNAFVPVGGIITLVGVVAFISAAFFRRAHVRALAAYDGNR